MFKKYHVILYLIVISLLAFCCTCYAIPDEDSNPDIYVWPRFWQWESPWDTDHYAGQPTKPFQQHGCLITSFAMLFNYHGIKYTPDRFHYPKLNESCIGKEDIPTCQEGWYKYERTNPRHINKFMTDKNLFKAINTTRNGGPYVSHEPIISDVLSQYYLQNGPALVTVGFNDSCRAVGRDGDCSRVLWSSEDAEKLLDNDLLNKNPDIMKIKWSGPNRFGVITSHPTHFVLIGGYSWEDGYESYRAYDPNRGYNRYLEFPPGLKKLYNEEDDYSHTPLRIDRYQQRILFNQFGPSRSRFIFSLLSPIDIQIVRPDGKITGYDPATKENVTDIPHAFYTVDSESSVESDGYVEPKKTFYVNQPRTGNYIIKVFGTGDGPYTIMMEGTKEDGSVNLETSITGTAYLGLQETYRIKYSPTGEASLSHDNQPPSADAGASQTGEQGYEIKLDGSASNDPDGDPLKYTWTLVSKPTGSQVALSDPGIAQPTFTPDIPGTYALQLAVNDYFTDSQPSIVTITALPIKSRIAVAPNLAAPLHAGPGVIAFDVVNTGRAGVSSGRIDASLTDPAGAVVWSGSQNFTLPVGQAATVQIPATVPLLQFGNYTLTFAESDETRSGLPATAVIPNSASATFSFDKLAYRVRETAKLTLNLANSGRFDLANTTVSLTVPDAGYVNARTLSAWQGEALQYDLPIPPAISSGQHDVTVTLTLPSGSAVAYATKLTIPPSALRLGHAGPGDLQAGDAITLTIANPGGVDTNYTTEKLLVTDANGTVLLQENVTGSVLSGEEKTLVDLAIPLQTATGAAQLYAKLIDSKTGLASSLKVPLAISGLEASLSARMEKDTYLNTEPVAALATVATGALEIDDGQLDVRIKRYTPFKEEKFTDFLPKNWWPFWYPGDVAVAPDGSVYAADGDRIVKFDGNGNFVAMWGEGELNYAQGIAVSQDGYVYVADSHGNCIWKFFNDGTFVTKWGSSGTGAGQFDWPSKVAVSPDGIVFVSDSYNHRIQKFDVNGNYLATWGEGQLLWPWGIGVNAEGDVYVIDGGCTMSDCSDHHRILKFDRYGNYVSEWGGRGSGDGKFDTPWGLTIGADGSVYVADSDNYRVQRFDGNGNFLGKWGSYGVGTGEFGWFTGISAGTDGSVYVADSEHGRIQRFTDSGNFIGKWGQEFDRPTGIALDDDGSIYVADKDNHRIMKYDGDGDYVSSVGATGAGVGKIYRPEDVAVSHDGFIYVTDTGNHRVHKFDASGNFILRWGAPGSGWGSPGSDDGLFNNPMAVVVAPNNTVYVVDQGNHRVQQFDADGHFLAKFGSYGSAAGQFKDPHDIAVASDGSVYVVDSSNHRIQKFDSAGNFLTQWGQQVDWWAKTDGKFLSPRSIAVAPDGAVYVGSDSRVQKFDGNGNFLGKWEDSGSGPGQFYAADGLVIGTDGTLYLSDRFNNRIERTRQVVVAAGEEIVRQESVSLSQVANTTGDYTKNFSALTSPGKYYLEDRLINRLDQTLATAEDPFYVIAGETALEFATDKAIYKPGETVTISGRVGNLSAIAAASLLLDLSANDKKIFTTTVDLSTGEYQPFTATTIAGVEGSVALSGRVSQNDSVLVETSDRYQVAVPHLSLSIAGPAVVGRSPFAVDLVVTNTGAFDFSGQLSLTDGQGEIDQRSLVLPAGKTWRHEYSQQIGQSKTYTVNVTGEVAQSASTTVGYGEAALISFGVQNPVPPPRTEPAERGRETERPPEKPPAPSPAPTYSEGNVVIPVTITNTGQLSEELAVNYVLSDASGVLRTESRSYYLHPGESISDKLDFDLTKGSYLLAATSAQPFAAAQFPFAVAGSDVATMTTTVGSPDGNGLVPMMMTVVNGGHNTINGTIAVAVLSNAGKALWRSEVLVSNLAPLTSQNHDVYVDTAGIISGVYPTNVTFDNASGQKLAENVTQLRIPGPIFEIVALPGRPVFTVGKVAHLSFTVKNTGTQSGTARFSVKALEWLNEFSAVTLGPGEEENIDFSFTLPEDVEEGDYLLDYALTPVDSQVSNGQVPFHVAEIKLEVTATLDKAAYKTGDTAILELTIAKQGQFEDGEYIAIIRYGAYLDMKPVVLTATPAVVTFSVPLPEITGEGLFYGIHFASGRTISQNMLPINRAQADLVIDELSASPGALTNDRLQVLVLNNGELPTVATTVAFFDGDPHSEQYVAIGQQAIPALLPGQSAAAVIDWNVAGKAGTHAVYAVADPDDLVTERSEANNIRSIDVSILDFALGVSTLQTQYGANQNVGIVQTVANLSSATILNSAQLSTTINSPSGSAVAMHDDNLPTLAPGEASFARSWDSASNIPGLYHVEAELKQSATILASAATTFEILPSVLIDGNVALPSEVVRGFPLDVGYALVNKGNIDLATGEVEVFFTRKESDLVAASFAQPFGPLTVLASGDGAIHLAAVELESGEYLVRIKAKSLGEEYLIGEKELRVLPPIEVVHGASTAPRVLVLVGKQNSSRDTIVKERMIFRKKIISQALDSLDTFYLIVETRDEFKQEMRSGIYNLFILASEEPLVDHIDAELRERVFSGDGLILLDYDHLTDSKLKDILAAQSRGYLPDAGRTLGMVEHGQSDQRELSIIGKVEKLSVLRESDVVAYITDKGASFPGIIDNSFGDGTVITFAFDVALSAQVAGETAAYRQLLADAVIHGAPKEAATIPGVPFGIEWTFKGVGQTFDIKVVENQDSALSSLLTYPISSVQEGGITWEFNLSGQEIERLVHLVKLPEQGGSFVIPSEIYYLNNGNYTFYNSYVVDVFADGLTALEMAILTELQSINDVRARNISTAYQTFMRRSVPDLGRQELEGEIHNLLVLMKSSEELAADTTGLRRNLGKLLKVFERRWVEVGR